jgi:hypothetical protein
LKRQIAAGDVSAAQTLVDPPAYAGSWTVAELLISQRNWGRATCEKFLARNGLSERKLIRELTARQRSLLAAQLK